MVLPVNPSSSDQIKLMGNQRYMVSLAFHKSTQTESIPEPDYKAKIALQEKQIRTLTDIIDDLRDKICKGDSVLDCYTNLNQRIELLKEEIVASIKDDNLLKSVKELFSAERSLRKEDDIKKAMKLRALKRTGHPLQDESTLRKWRCTIQVKDDSSFESNSSKDDGDQIKVHSGPTTDGNEDLIGQRHFEYNDEDIKNEDSVIEQLEVKGRYKLWFIICIYELFYIVEEKPLIIEDYIFENAA